VLCAYLIQVCGLTVDEALASFAAARPPGVKHEKFVAEVRRPQSSRRPASGLHLGVKVSAGLRAGVKAAAPSFAAVQRSPPVAAAR